ARQTGSRVVKVWLGDGTNYPGQDDFRARRRHLIESLQEVYPALPGGARLFLEYKLYEPAFYHTDVQDWGQALSVRQDGGGRAQVCVDTGHHSLGVNIEQIVAYLLQEGRLGGFDLNDKKYGDDDLMVGSIDPYQLFRICHELVKALAGTDDATARACAEQTVYMLDQSHNIEPKLPAVVRSVMNLQEAFAKALLVDQTALSAAQSAGEVLEANAIMKDAFDTDVRPLLAEARAAAGLPEDPYRAFLASGELERRVAGRVGGGGRRRGAGRWGGDGMAVSQRTFPIQAPVARWQPPASASELELLTYRSNQLGADRSVANWGGGNTSCKATEIDFRGRPTRVLWVKGSGSDLATIRAEQFTGLRLDDVEPLFERQAMSDEDLVTYYEHAALRPRQPRAS